MRQPVSDRVSALSSHRLSSHGDRRLGRRVVRAARRGLLALGAGCIVASSVALASSIGSESSIGIASEYSSNPYMLSSGARAAESGAVQVNLPATYNSDAQTIDLIPRARFAKT
jgi:hypothetical protein